MASVERQVRLLDLLRQSNLLTPEQLAALAREPAADADDPQLLAKFLVQKRWLTRFQISQVLQGKAKALVLGAYRVLDCIGEGGMGNVFKAHHVPMNRTVALKLIRKEKLANPGAVRRFYQEAQTAAQLIHPNIVLAYDAGQLGARHFLAMEFVDGIDLARLVRKSGPLPVIQACDYIRQAALGLQHAYERGVVHRDIKPANLLVTAGSPAVVKILDMGLARLATANQTSGVTHDGAVLGTPDYLAPEQALDSKNADIRSDIYSLGCTFYFLLTGRPPYQGGSLTEILLKHQMEPLVPPEKVRSDVPPAVGVIVGKLLAKRPEDRFQTPAEAAASLEPFCRGDFSATAITAAVPDAEADWQSLTQGDDEGMAALREAVATDRTAVATRTPSVERATKPLPPDRRYWLLVGLGGGLPALAGILLLVYLFTRPNRPKIPPEPTAPAPVFVEQKQPGHPDTTVTPAPPRVDPPPVHIDPPPPRIVNVPPVDLGPLATGEIRRLGDGRTLLRACVVLPDGKRALAGFGSDLVLWDLTTGGVVRRYPSDRVVVRLIAVSRDGRIAATAGSDRTIRVWDVETGQEKQQLKGHTSEIRCLGLTPDGRLALSGGGTPVVRDGKVVQANGRTVYDDLGVRVWDTATGQELRRFMGHETMLHALVFTPDGRQALSLPFDGRASLWDVETLAEVPEFKLPRTLAASVAIAPDGKRALIGNFDRSLVLVDLPTGNEVRRITGLETPVNAVAFLPGGKQAVTGSGINMSRDNITSYPDCVVRLWDLEAGRALGQFTGHKQPVRAVAVTPLGDQVLSCADDNTLRLWDLARIPAAANMPSPIPPKPAPPVTTRGPFEGHKLPVTSVAWSRDGKRIVTGSRDKTVRLWDAETGKELHVFPGPVDEIRSVAFSRDNKKIVACEKTGYIFLWDADTFAGLGTLSVGRDVALTSVAFSYDSKQVIYSEIRDGRGSVHGWSPAGGTSIPSVNAPVGITCAILTEDGAAMIYGCDDGSLRIRDMMARRDLPPTKPHQHPVTCLALSPKGASFLSGSGTAATAAGKPAPAKNALSLSTLTAGFVRSFSGHTDQVMSVVFLPDGKRALSGSKDKTVRLWEVGSGNQLRKFEGHEGPVLGVAVSPDGKRAVSVGDGIRVWDLQKMVAAQ